MNIIFIYYEKIDMNKIEFEAFIIKYINSLNKILYKSPMESIILYRGEVRSEFNIKINDILLYKNFHSSTDSISFAFNFSKYSNLETDFSKIKLLLVLKIPNGFNYIKLNEKPKKIIYNISIFRFWFKYILLKKPIKMDAIEFLQKKITILLINIVLIHNEESMACIVYCNYCLVPIPGPNCLRTTSYNHHRLAARSRQGGFGTCGP
jgi:hypothetical protein